MPACTLIALSFSAPLPNLVDTLDIPPFVDGLAIHLSPGVCFEGKLLRAHDHLRLDSASPQYAGHHGGALQAEDTLWIPDACVIHRMANSVNDVVCVNRRHDGPMLNESVDSGEILTETKKIKYEQTHEGLREQ
jgi:hypothetical protein